MDENISHRVYKNMKTGVYLLRYVTKIQIFDIQTVLSTILSIGVL